MDVVIIVAECAIGFTPADFVFRLGEHKTGGCGKEVALILAAQVLVAACPKQGGGRDDKKCCVHRPHYILRCVWQLVQYAT